VRLRQLSIAALAVLLVAAAPAAASRRRAPPGFYGVSWDPVLERQLPESVKAAQWSLMARSGVESVRVVFSWDKAQPAPEDLISFARTDPVVARAARRRLRLLPVIVEAPLWAQADPFRRNSPPANPYAFAAYVRALVLRYGSRGSFWRQHPRLHRLPITDWQIWNEPNLDFYWNAPRGTYYGWPGGYVRLLRAVHRTIKAHDRKAKLVLAGLTGDPWTQLRLLYHRHARRLFDVAAVHPYNANPRAALALVGAVRHTMRRFHDGHKPLWVTELGWPAARGKISVDPGLARFTTTDRGMAGSIGPAYGAFLRRRRNPHYGAGRLYWFTWASTYRARGEAGIWNYAGLLVDSPSGFIRTPSLGAYRRSARRYEGCAKGPTGACRR
jgi:hypothetical protein